MRLSQALGLAETARDTDSAEIVVLYTGPDLTPCALRAAANLTKGLNFHVVLIAVHIVPFPAQLEALAVMEEHLRAELSKVAEESDLPVTARIAFARDLAEALRQCVRPESLVVIASRKHWWRTWPEQWARELARNGFRTALVQSRGKKT
jgi:hypothetical protein